MTVSPIELAGRARLARRGFVLEYATSGWNVVGTLVSAWMARSAASAGFGLDSLIEVGASIVAVWELSGAVIDGILATAVLLGLVLNAAAGWSWAGPAAGCVLVCYVVREVLHTYREHA